MCISTVNCTYSTWITTQAFKQSLLQGIDIWLTGAHKKWWKWLCGKRNKSLREDWTLPTFTPSHTWTVAVWSVQQCVYMHTSSPGQYWFFCHPVTRFPISFKHARQWVNEMWRWSCLTKTEPITKFSTPWLRWEIQWLNDKNLCSVYWPGVTLCCQSPCKQNTWRSDNQILECYKNFCI